MIYLNRLSPRRTASSWLGVLTLTVVSMLISAPHAYAFDMAKTMKVGGWAEREDVTVNAKGKETDRAKVWMGVVGEETINGVDHIWLESRIQTVKVNRKGVQKPKGKPAVMKTLIEKSVLGDFTNPIDNMRKFAKEIIIQTGKEKPMRVTGGGIMADSALKAFGTTADFSFDSSGVSETVTVPAGTLRTTKMTGSSSVEMKVVIRKIRVETEMECWLSEDVPLGIVKQISHIKTNGKASVMTTELLSYGNTGATSLIDDSQVQDMPAINLPKLPKLPKFGG